jgi:hypothetical protein
MSYAFQVAVGIVLGAQLGCAGSQGMNVSEPVTDSAIAVEVVAEGLSNPVVVTAPSNDLRLFIVEQPGRIRIVQGGQLLGEPFLDITDRVRSGGERGLLGLAFHPDYAANGLFYVDYTDRNGDTRVERYRATADPNLANAASNTLVITIPQPYGNHNGGQVSFGPDGMLYIGMGDGGSANDPQNNGQNAGTLLGALLRIDVDGGAPYAVPADNPFRNDAQARGEIWAIGLRNPWRFAFDPEGGFLYVGDVGQNQWEEIDVVPADAPGINYGWNLREGSHCFGGASCGGPELADPALEYGHDNGCSVIGGFVYRGTELPAVVGHYFYSDYCSGWLRSFRYADGRVEEHKEWAVGSIGPVLSFGEDAARNLYLTSSSGRVYRLVSR